MTNPHRTHRLLTEIDELRTWELLMIVAGIIGVLVGAILAWPAMVELAPTL